jgi:hypothetical protein
MRDSIQLERERETRARRERDDELGSTGLFSLDGLEWSSAVAPALSSAPLSLSQRTHARLDPTLERVSRETTGPHCCRAYFPKTGLNPQALRAQSKRVLGFARLRCGRRVASAGRAPSGLARESFARAAAGSETFPCDRATTRAFGFCFRTTPRGCARAHDPNLDRSDEISCDNGGSGAWIYRAFRASPSAAEKFE